MLRNRNNSFQSGFRKHIALEELNYSLLSLGCVMQTYTVRDEAGKVIAIPDSAGVKYFSP